MRSGLPQALQTRGAPQGFSPTCACAPGAPFLPRLASICVQQAHIICVQQAHIILPRAPPTKALWLPGGARCGPCVRPWAARPRPCCLRCAALPPGPPRHLQRAPAFTRARDFGRPACGAKQRFCGMPEAGPGRSSCTLQATSYATPSATRPGAEATRPLGLCVLAAA